MKVVRTIAEVRDWRYEGSLGLVPTMGALHEGHLSLIRAARAANEAVAATIFVNPLQFGPKEDLARYPRTFEADRALLEAEGVDLLFAPEPTEMYPDGFAASIDPGPVGTRLDGASRPGHFNGVATVVAKLWNIFTPIRAYFGQKDAAQVAVLRHLARDLAFPVALVVCPIVREPDGLAMSSRNRYLSDEERRQALVLSQALRAAGALRGTANILNAAQAVLAEEPGFRPDYLALVDPDTLLPCPDGSQKQALLAVAGWIGATRLIDNALLSPA